MRIREKRGVTDYRRRYRMLARNGEVGVKKNYRPVYRVLVGKKNRYLYAGLYSTPAHHLPDVCHYYADTRTITQSELVQRLALMIKARVPKGAMTILDKGRRKKLRLQSFNKSLSEELVRLSGPVIRGAA